MRVLCSLGDTAATKRSLQRSALPSGGKCGLVLLSAVLGACGAGYDSVQVQGPPRCAVRDEPTRSYAITSFLLPSSTHDYAEDLDGDGRPDNQLGEYLSYGGLKGAFPSLPFGTVEGLINRQLGELGRGVLLLDVKAQEQSRGCAQISVRTAAAPAAGGAARKRGDPFVVATGSQRVLLRAAGSQAELATLAYDQMSAADAQTLEVFMPLETTAHRFRLHGVRIELTQSGPTTVRGTLRGVLKKSELPEALWPVWAREFTELVHKFSSELSSTIPDSPISAVIKERISNLEQATGKQKCTDTPADCCTDAPKSCHIYPSQLRQYYQTSVTADLDAFSEDGTWKLTAGSALKDRDSLSVAFGFTAERTEIVEGCPPGSFCTLATDSSLFGGWANSSSDLWITAQGGRAWHHDGLAFWKEREDLQLGPSWSYSGPIWGASSDDVWTAFSEQGAQGKLAFRRWNGGAWAPDKFMPPTGIQTHVVTAMTGKAADDVWALGRDVINDKHQLWHSDGRQWQLLRESDTALSALYSPRKGQVFIAGDRGVVLQRSDGGWRDFAVGGLNFVSITGSSERNVWAVSSVANPAKGDCRHFDGAAWETQPPGFCEVQDRTYAAAWMDASGVLWVGGSNRMLRRYDPQKDSRFVDIPSDIPARVMKGGVEQDNPEGVKLLFGDAAEGAVWALTDAGRLLRYQP